MVNVMPSGLWLFHCLVTVVTVCLVFLSTAEAQLKRITAFRYCGYHIPVDEHEGYKLEIFGRYFPVSVTTCQLSFASTDADDKLLYRVTSAAVFKINEEIALDSSKDGRHYNSEEFISTTSSPKKLGEEMVGQHYLNLSAVRTSGFVESTFAVVIEIYGEDFHPADSGTTRTYVNGSITLGIVLGIGCLVIFIIITAMYLKKNKIARNLQRNRRTCSQQRHTQPQPDGTTSTDLGDMRQPASAPSFPPPYSSGGPGESNIFTVQPQPGYGPAPLYSAVLDDLPPSYDEAMKSGLREVTL